MTSNDQLLPATGRPGERPAAATAAQPGSAPGERLATGQVLNEAEAAALKRIQVLSYWLDDRFRIPLLNRRIGLDGLLGLVPGVGDAATTLLSLYVITEAYRLGVPWWRLARMAANVGIDGVLGSVPLVGDLFDVAWKANRRNVRHLHAYLDAKGRR